MQKTSDFIKLGLKSKPCAKEQSQAVFTSLFEFSGFDGRFICKCIDEGAMFCGSICLTTINQAVQDTTQCR